MNIKNGIRVLLPAMVLWSGMSAAEVVDATNCSLRSWDTNRGSVTVRCSLTVNNNEITYVPAPADNPQSVSGRVYLFFNNGDVTSLGGFTNSNLPADIKAGTTIADLVRRGLIPPITALDDRVMPLADVDSNTNSGHLLAQVRVTWGATLQQGPMLRIPIANVPVGCSLSAAGATNIELRHGPQVRTTSGGSHVITSNITLGCQIPSTVRVSVLNRADIQTSIADVASTLAFDGTNYSKVYSSVMGNQNIALTSTLNWPAASAGTGVGAFNGSGIILLDIP